MRLLEMGETLYLTNEACASVESLPDPVVWLAIGPEVEDTTFQGSQVPLPVSSCAGDRGPFEEPLHVARGPLDAVGDLSGRHPIIAHIEDTAFYRSQVLGLHTHETSG
jgi:hypothetical protein